MNLDASGGDRQTASPGRPIDSIKIAYQLLQPMGMVSDTLIVGALALDGNEREWAPQVRGGWFRPLLLNVSHGYYIDILQVCASGSLSRHHHHGPVDAFTLRGTWRYLEHHWVASAGDYPFEPAGETHTLVVPNDAAGMTTLFHVTCGYTYIGPHGVALGDEDDFTRLKAARRHCESIGFGKDYVRRMVR